MEYPSHGSYQVKEKSVEGDYAISRKLNDLSYTFVFPAGTSEINCKLSLDTENWCGVSLNAKENPSFWETDENSNVDFTKPMTFNRTDGLAEQDEYGILYRDFLKEKNIQGFKNYDKIYWKLSYVCNGKSLTHSFEISLFDYDKAEKHVLKTVNFNVAGLPFAVLTNENIAANQKHAGRYLSSNDFDIVSVQEDFGYHKQLVENMEGFSHSTNHTGGIPGGDGLNVFTKDMPIYNENGKPISDHVAAECDFTFIKTPEFVENTQELQVNNKPHNTFLRLIKWIFKDLIMIISDIGNLPFLIKEFAENLT